MSATTYRVRIEGLLVQVRVGVSTRERERPQNVRFDVHLELPGAALPRRDVLRDVVADYDVLATRVFEEASAKPVRLLETLVGRVAEALLRTTPAERVRVAATKVPTPTRVPVDAAWVEVEAVRAAPAERPRGRR